MRRRPLRVFLALLVGAFLAPAAVAQYCYEGSSCYFAGTLGCAEYERASSVPCPVATPAPTPTPTPVPTPIEVREGVIYWRPDTANYVQSPWAMMDAGVVYVGAHAGHCCPDLYDPQGWESPYVMRWDDYGVTSTWPVIDLAPDTHEVGFGTVVWYDDRWLYAGARTTKSSWIVMTQTGFQNRARIFFAATPDLMRLLYPWVWWDAILTLDLNCWQRNTCSKTAPGPFMPALVWIDGTLWLFDHDGVGSTGTAQWIITLSYDPKVARYSGRSIPDFPWSDIALADDGKLYALVSARDGSRLGEAPCWWSGCHVIDEYVSEDGGLTWTRGARSWSARDGLGVWDACFLRDRLGHIQRSALVVVALTGRSPEDPTSDTWHLRWWADAGALLPASWGHEPGWRFPRVRRHLAN